MIRAICFDFDGTLAHFTGDFDDLLNEGFAKLGLDPQKRDAVLTEYTQQLRKDGAVTSLSALIETLGRLGLHADCNLEEVNTEFVQAYKEQMELLPGAREMLEFFKGRVSCALITNGPEDMQRAAIQEVEIADYFRTILISGAQEVAVRKPDARILRLACERLEVLPEETLMVGDNLGADIRGALEVGIKAVYIGAEEANVPRVADLFELRESLGAQLESPSV